MKQIIIIISSLIFSNIIFADYEKGVQLFNQKEFKASFDEFMKSAQQGDAKSQYGVASAYYYGEGVKQDFTSAHKWMLKSANNGLGSAKVFLGVMYDQGQGVKRDTEKMHQLWNEASAGCNAPAYTMLASAYFTGNGVAKDPVVALAFAMAGKKLGAPEAPQAIEVIGSVLSDTDVKKATEYYQQIQQAYQCTHATE